MTTSDAGCPGRTHAKDHGRAGRDLPAAIGSAVVLVAAILLSLFFWKTAFMGIVAVAVAVAVWELHRGLSAKDIDIPEQPLMLGGVVDGRRRLLLGCAGAGDGHGGHRAGR